MIVDGNTYYKIASGSLLYKIPTEERPYISGHVTDGSSTFTFRVNNNNNITVQVDNNGWFKWYSDRTITSLMNCLRDCTNIDIVIINQLNNITTLYAFANDSGTLSKPATNLEYAYFIGCDLSSVIYVNNIFRYCSKLKLIKGIESLSPSENNANSGGGFTGTKITEIHPGFFKNITRLVDHFYGTKLTYADISQAELDYFRNTFQASTLETLVMGNVKSTMEFSGSPFGNYLKNLSFAEGKKVYGNIPINSTSVLTKQSVINMVNAAATNVTYTLHSTVYNKCASGGEWYTDIQAAIDAKAQQGYTVTLISA